MTAREPLDEKVKRVVFGQSGGYCVNPDCRAPLHRKQGETEIWIGEAAHIHGERPGAERYDPSLSAAERNADSNLIALCPTCHTTVDKPGAAASYPATVLFLWKSARSHEVDSRAAARVVDVGFYELSRIVTALVEGGLREDEDEGTSVVPPADKLAFNGLSSEVHRQVVVGLLRAPEVKRYLSHERRVNPNISSLARRAIVEEYRRCRSRAQGDQLFHMVWDGVAAGRYSDEDRAAALVITCYFFEACDIFERVPA